MAIRIDADQLGVRWDTAQAQATLGRLDRWRQSGGFAFSLSSSGIQRAAMADSLVNGPESLSSLQGKHTALASISDKLTQMRSLTSFVERSDLTDGDRSSYVQQIATLKSDIDRLSSSALDGRDFLPKLKTSSSAYVDGASGLQEGSVFAGREVTSLGVSGAAAGGRFVFSTAATFKKTVVMAGGTLKVNQMLDNNQVTLVDVNNAALGHSYRFDAVSTWHASVASNSQVKVSSKYDTDTITDIDLTGADPNSTFTFTRVSNYLGLGGGSWLQIKNNATGDTQTIDITSMAKTNGTKVINYDQFGVKITMTGTAESGTDKLASALNGKKLITAPTTALADSSPVHVGSMFDTNMVSSIDVSGATANDTYQLSHVTGSQVRLTNTATGANQTIDIGAMSKNSGDKTINFTQLKVTITLTGPGESAKNALATALDGGTIVTNSPLYASQLRLTDITSGAAQTIDVASLFATNGSKTLNFDKLGIVIGLIGPHQSGLETLFSALNGQTIVKAQTVIGSGGGLTLTNTLSGASQTLDPSAFNGTHNDVTLDFNALGVKMTLAGGPVTAQSLIEAFKGTDLRTNPEQATALQFDFGDQTDVPQLDTAGTATELDRFIERATQDVSDLTRAVEQRITEVTRLGVDKSGNYAPDLVPLAQMIVQQSGMAPKAHGGLDPATVAKLLAT